MKCKCGKACKLISSTENAVKKFGEWHVPSYWFCEVCKWDVTE